MRGSLLLRLFRMASVVMLLVAVAMVSAIPRMLCSIFFLSVTIPRWVV